MRTYTEIAVGLLEQYSGPEGDEESMSFDDRCCNPSLAVACLAMGEIGHPQKTKEAKFVEIAAEIAVDYPGFAIALLRIADGRGTEADEAITMGQLSDATEKVREEKRLVADFRHLPEEHRKSALAWLSDQATEYGSDAARDVPA